MQGIFVWLYSWTTPEKVTAIVAFAGLIGIPAEYRRQRTQSRLELAQKLIECFQSDDMIAFAVTSLDWGDGIIPVPMAWRDVIGAASIIPDPKELLAAVEYGLTDKTKKDPVRLLYRHSFVSLFNHLERMEDLRSAGAVTASDLLPIVWIAAYIDEWPYNPYPDKPPFRDALNGWYEEGKLLRLISALLKEKKGRSAVHEKLLRK